MIDGVRGVVGATHIIVDVPTFSDVIPHFDAVTLEDLREYLGAATTHRGEVYVHGEPPDFSDVSDDVTISLSTRAVSGDRDWFDLAVDVTVDGTKVALTEVISGIVQGESHLLLDDGRYFDLRTEQLSKLRSLIEEARALQDSPTGPLRLSRFQAGLWEELTAFGVVKRQAKA